MNFFGEAEFRPKKNFGIIYNFFPTVARQTKFMDYSSFSD
jgi:hypothetical protein